MLSDVAIGGILGGKSSSSFDSPAAPPMPDPGTGATKLPRPSRSGPGSRLEPAADVSDKLQRHLGSGLKGNRSARNPLRPAARPGGWNKLPRARA